MSQEEMEVFDQIEFVKNILKPEIHPQVKQSSHIELKKRFDKANKVFQNCLFALETKSESPIQFTIAGQRAKVPSQRPGEEDHYCTFAEKLDCDCESFMRGNVHDKNFECYHIIAARLFWQWLTSRGKSQ